MKLASASRPGRKKALDEAHRPDQAHDPVPSGIGRSSAEAPKHLDFVIGQFQDMKIQPSREPGRSFTKS